MPNSSIFYLFTSTAHGSVAGGWCHYHFTYVSFKSPIIPPDRSPFQVSSEIQFQIPFSPAVQLEPPWRGHRNPLQHPHPPAAAPGDLPQKEAPRPASKQTPGTRREEAARPGGEAAPISSRSRAFLTPCRPPGRPPIKAATRIDPAACQAGEGRAALATRAGNLREKEPAACQEPFCPLPRN